MRLVRRGTELVVQLDDGEKVSGHRPSVDALFESVARSCGPRAVGVIMTGMGADGATGLTSMREAGAWTIAQDDKTSIVYGMPKEAVERDAVDHVVPLPKIPFAVAKLLQRGQKQARASV
jgi:two-component system chemotaxis response regulator CheB